MQTPEPILNGFSSSDDTEKYKRRYRLIHYITWELIAVCAIITTLYAISELWFLVIVIAIAVSLALINLYLLSKTQNTILCSHIITLIIFLTIISTNYLIWGTGPLHSQWFYVMPLLAASFIGMNGLFIYATGSLIVLLCVSKFPAPPYYDLPAYQFMVIETLNHLFAYIIIVTTLASLIHENQQFEQELHDKNQLLETEKDKYRYLARFDHLTNLANRRYFIQHLHELIETLTPEHYLTVFFLDLDNFKQVNDHYGHNTGDQLLLETSKRLRHCFHQDDFIARLGGDEFTALVVHPPNKSIPKIIAQNIIREFESVFILENKIEYHFSLSIGSATYPLDAQTVSDLLIKADLAMYAAKKVNGSSYCSVENCNEKLHRFL